MNAQLPIFQDLTTQNKVIIDEHYRPDAKVVFYSGQVADLLKEMPNDAIKLIVTSPPYNIGKKYETRQNVETYLEEQTSIIEQLVRVLSPTGSLCWQVGNFVDDGEVFPLDILYYPIFKNLGLKLRNRIIWRFGHGLHTTYRLSGRYETILWFSKSDTYTFDLDNIRIPAKYPGKRHFRGPKKGQLSGNPLGVNPTDVWIANVIQEWETLYWDIPNVKSKHPEKTCHPCQFPVELIQRLVLALTKPGDWVLDPYAGAGSALIAAIMHDRRAVGSEKEPEYVETALDRIRQLFEGTLPLRPMGMPVYEPTGNESVSQFPKEWMKT